MKNYFNPHCLSYYLGLRFIPDNKISWIKNKKILTNLPTTKIKKDTITNSQDIIRKISTITKKYQNKKVGILLSSGIDSIIIASFLPKQTQAYTVRFLAKNSIDESIYAAKIAKHLGLKHKIITVQWKDYLRYKKKLMLNKNSPLHPVEVGIYCAALQAHKDGISNLFTGCGADATFGGLDKLLSQKWTYKKFINRYNFLDPKLILKKPANINNIYKKYKKGRYIEIQKFIKEVFGLQTEQLFHNAISTAQCKIIAPFEKMKLSIPLDINRIKNGEPKYLLYEVYKKLYPTIKPNPKIPFARPMDEWMKDWNDIHRPEFRKDINIKELTGEQKWLVYCLQDFMDLIEKND